MDTMPTRARALALGMAALALAPFTLTAQVRDELLTRVPVARTANPDAVAIVIGNRNYLQKTLPAVDFAERDAWAVRAYLISAMGLDSTNIVYLENATQGQMRSYFGSAESPNAKLKRMLRPGKSDVFVFYSGHGAPDLRTSNAYLVPVDGDPSDMANSGFAVDVLYKNLSLLGARSVTVMMDACFSGLSEGGSLYTGTSGGRLRVTNPVVAATGTAALLAASNNQMAVWHQEKQHGAFTYFLLKGIQELAAKQPDKVTLGTLHDVVSENVRFYAGRARNLDQDTQLQTRDSSRVFGLFAVGKFVDMPARGAAPEPKPITMVRKTADKAVPVGNEAGSRTAGAVLGAAGAVTAAATGAAGSTGAAAVKTAPAAAAPVVTAVTPPVSAPSTPTTAVTFDLAMSLAQELTNLLTARKYDEFVARFKESASTSTRNKTFDFLRKYKPNAKIVLAEPATFPGAARAVVAFEWKGPFGNLIARDISLITERGATGSAVLVDVLNLP